ncbi:MAG: hypothetical protein LBQ76_03475 [Candidatus Fibromonas sp.]|jgi:hypothetical protein|nr:hypothetical protein [Candidatus Fibromonas sp.]
MPPKHLALAILLFAFTAHSGDNTLTYGGQTYKTVKIGKQTWLAENLNYEAISQYSESFVFSLYLSSGKRGKFPNFNIKLGNQLKNRTPGVINIAKSVRNDIAAIPTVG